MHQHAQTGLHRAQAFLGGHNLGPHVAVPVADEADDGHRGDGAFAQRQDDAPVHPQIARAVDVGGFQQGVVDGLIELAEQEHGEHAHQRYDDHREEGVGQPKRGQGEKVADDGGLAGDHHGAQEQEEDGLGQLKGQLGEGVARQRAGKDLADDHGGGHEDAVFKILAKGRALPGDGVVFPIRLGGPEDILVHYLMGSLERAGNHPEDGKNHQQRYQRENQDAQRFLPGKGLFVPDRTGNGGHCCIAPFLGVVADKAFQTHLNQVNQQNQRKQHHGDGRSIAHLIAAEGVVIEHHGQVGRGVAGTAAGHVFNGGKQLHDADGLQNQQHERGGRYQRHGDFPGGLPGVRAVDVRGLDDFFRDVLDGAQVHHHAVAQRAPDGDDDDGHVGGGGIVDPSQWPQPHGRQRGVEDAVLRVENVEPYHRQAYHGGHVRGIDQGAEDHIELAFLLQQHAQQKAEHQDKGQNVEHIAQRVA